MAAIQRRVAYLGILLERVENGCAEPYRRVAVDGNFLRQLPLPIGHCCSAKDHCTHALNCTCSGLEPPLPIAVLIVVWREREELNLLAIGMLRAGLGSTHPRFPLGWLAALPSSSEASPRQAYLKNVTLLGAPCEMHGE